MSQWLAEKMKEHGRLGVRQLIDRILYLKVGSYKTFLKKIWTVSLIVPIRAMEIVWPVSKVTEKVTVVDSKELKRAWLWKTWWVAPISKIQASQWIRECIPVKLEIKGWGSLFELDELV